MSPRFICFFVKSYSVCCASGIQILPSVVSERQTIRPVHKLSRNMSQICDIYCARVSIIRQGFGCYADLGETVSGRDLYPQNRNPCGSLVMANPWAKFLFVICNAVRCVTLADGGPDACGHRQHLPHRVDGAMRLSEF